MFYCNVEEIKNNNPISKIDISEMAYYIRQTFERYSELVRSGYLSSEVEFSDPDGEDTEVNPFKPDSSESLAYAKTSLQSNLNIMHEFIYVAKNKMDYLHESGATDGHTCGGLNDFMFDVLSPCLAYQSLNEYGVMDTFYGSEKIHALLIHFFAALKLECGSLCQPDCPDLMFVDDHIGRGLNIDSNHFSFRELTLLSGYKTERAVRNLASPSTPANRRLRVIKVKRHTYVEHSEAKRWLAENKK
jgi:hypothetical protein